MPTKDKTVAVNFGPSTTSPCDKNKEASPGIGSDGEVSDPSVEVEDDVPQRTDNVEAWFRWAQAEPSFSRVSCGTSTQTKISSEGVALDRGIGTKKTTQTHDTGRTTDGDPTSRGVSTNEPPVIRQDLIRLPSDRAKKA